MSASGIPHPKIQVRFLGSFTVSDGSRDLTSALAQPKRVALVALLALTRPYGLHRRDTLCAQLWPESPDDKARAALRQLLLVLRRDLGEDAFLTQGDLVGLNRDRVTTDAGDVFDALETGNDAIAVDRCTGELLPGFHLPESEGFERWFEDCRRDLQQGVRGAAWRLVDRAEANGDLAAARRAAERAMAIDPENEQGLRRLLTFLARTGDRGAALRIADEFARKLRQDWDTALEGATQDLIQRIRSGQLAPAHPPVLPEPAVVAAADSGVATHPSVPGPAGGSNPPRTGRRPNLVAVAALGLVAVMALLAWRPDRPDRPIHPDRVLVTALENQTGDSALNALGPLAANWLATGILQAGVGEVVDPVTAWYAARDIGRTGGKATGTEGIRALAEAGAAGLVVTGTIRAEADSIVYLVQVSEGQSARLVGAFRVAVPARDAATAGIEELRATVGGFVAARLDPRVDALRPLAVAPPRLEAYQQFVEGLDYFGAQRYADALPLLLEAARLDSNFVTAVVWARYAAGNGGSWEVADSITGVARRLLANRGSRLAPLDRHGLEAIVASDVTSLRTALMAAARLAPGSDYTYRLARMYPFEYRKSIPLYESINRRTGWARDWPRLYGAYAKVLHLAGENGRAAALIKEAVSRGIDTPELRAVQAMALAAAGRPDEVRPVIEALVALPPDTEFLPPMVMASVAGELHRVGHGQEGNRMLERAREWTDAHQAALSPLDEARCRAWIAGYSGQWDDAITWFERVAAGQSAPLRPADIYDQVWLAIVAAYRHRDTLSRKAIAVVEADAGEPDHALRAMVAAVSGDPGKAVEMVHESAQRATWLYRHQEQVLHDPVFARFRESPSWQAFIGGQRESMAAGNPLSRVVARR